MVAAEAAAWGVSLTVGAEGAALGWGAGAAEAAPVLDSLTVGDAPAEAAACGVSLMVAAEAAAEAVV